MKVIFLDFDGVITTMKSRWNLCKEKMELVKEIVDKILVIEKEIK